MTTIDCLLEKEERAKMNSLIITQWGTHGVYWAGSESYRDGVPLRNQ